MIFEKELDGTDLFAKKEINDYIYRLPFGKRFKITIQMVDAEQSKTQRQHNWFFLHRVKPLAKALGLSPDEMYTALKDEFGFHTTADMTTKEFTEFVILLDAWCAEFHNFTFPVKY